MKKTILLPAVLLLLSFTSIAQQGSPTKTLKQTIELKMPKSADDDMPGTRGAAVVWHPVQQKYYAAFAGNINFPLAVFDAKGTRLSSADLTAKFDIRGMWYNPVSKTVQMNGYDDYGWAEYKLDSKGIPTEAVELFEGMNQPNAQSTGMYNTREKVVCFMNDEGNLEKYNTTSGVLIDEIPLYLGKTSVNDDFENADIIDDYNLSAAYTNQPGIEIALLNHYEKRIELYNQRTGYKIKDLNLPESASIESIFNFSYSNGIYWLFDIKNRKWIGYR